MDKQNPIHSLLLIVLKWEHCSVQPGFCLIPTQVIPEISGIDWSPCLTVICTQSCERLHSQIGDPWEESLITHPHRDRVITLSFKLLDAIKHSSMWSGEIMNLIPGCATWPRFFFSLSPYHSCDMQSKLCLSAFLENLKASCLFAKKDECAKQTAGLGVTGLC